MSLPIHRMLTLQNDSSLTKEYIWEEFYFPKGSRTPPIVTLKLTPAEDLVTGNYMLTVGARYGTVTYSKMVNLNVK
jgi:general stress protein 26